MTTDQRASDSQISFSSALFQSLTATMTKASGSLWQMEMTSETSLSSVGSGRTLVSCVLDGTLCGEFLLELGRDDAQTLASVFLGQPAAESGVEGEPAILSLINAWMRDFNSKAEQRYGALKTRASISSDKQLDEAAVFQAIVAGGANRISISMYLTPELAASLHQHSPLQTTEAPAMSAKKASEENAAPEPLNLNLVMDVELNVTLRFGQRKLTLREVLELATGSVVELDRQVEEPVELLLDGLVIARGEAVVVDGNYGLRVTEVLRPGAAAVLQ